MVSDDPLHHSLGQHVVERSYRGQKNQCGDRRGERRGKTHQQNGEPEGEERNHKKTTLISEQTHGGKRKHANDSPDCTGRVHYAQTLGPERSGHVRLGGVKGGKLVLFVDEPAYRYELQNYWYEPILQAVGREAPEAGVHELGFRLAALDGDHRNTKQA